MKECPYTGSKRRNAFCAMTEDDWLLMMLGSLTLFLWSVIAIMHWYAPTHQGALPFD
jgi:hypothetical protein